MTRQYSNRVVLDVQGSVADIEKAFHVTMRTYPHPNEARTFYAPDVEPSLAVGVSVLHIEGLDNYALPHPKHKQHSLNQAENATTILNQLKRVQLRAATYGETISVTLMCRARH